MTGDIRRSVRPPFGDGTIRVGIVGAGFGARVHLPVLRSISGVEVVALCDIDPERLRQAAEQHHIPLACEDFGQLIASGEIDAVSLAAPPDIHHGMAVAACEAGIHILCEKPLATSAAEARDLEHMVRDSSICHGVAFHRRYEPARQRMKELIDGGFIGDLHSVSVIVYRSTLRTNRPSPESWNAHQERGGGVLSTVASHYVDQLRWWFGEIHATSGLTQVALRGSVASGFGDSQEIQADDNTAFVLRFASGAIGSVSLSYTAAADIGEEIVVSGSEGMLAVQDADVIVGAKRGESVRSVMKRSATPVTAREMEVTSFRALATDWVAAIRSGGMFTPSFADGARVQEVIDAVTQSQRLRRWIDLSGEKWPV